MNNYGSLLVSAFIVLFCAGNADSVISQFIDHEGNVIDSDPGRRSTGTSGIRRYSIPEGIKLRNDIVYQFYPVFGNTFTEIVNSSLENGPLDRKENRRFPSSNRWALGWSYELAFTYVINEEDGKIHVSSELYDIQMKDEITITLPTLIDDTALNPIEKSLWKEYLNALVEHEHDHVKIIRDSARRDEFRKMLEDMTYLIFDYTGGIDVESLVERSLRAETVRKGKAWVEQIRNRLNEYDSLTERGERHEMRESFFKGKEKD